MNFLSGKRELQSIIFTVYREKHGFGESGSNIVGGIQDEYPVCLTNNKVRFNNNLVHEGLEYSGSPGELINPLDHFTDPSSEHYYNKFNHYTSLITHQNYTRIIKNQGCFRLI